MNLFYIPVFPLLHIDPCFLFPPSFWHCYGPKFTAFRIKGPNRLHSLLKYAITDFSFVSTVLDISKVEATDHLQTSDITVTIYSAMGRSHVDCGIRRVTTSWFYYIVAPLRCMESNTLHWYWRESWLLWHYQTLKWCPLGVINGACWLSSDAASILIAETLCMVSNEIIFLLRNLLLPTKQIVCLNAYI